MNIGLLGYGVIGSGVSDLLKDKVVKIFDLPSKKEIIGNKFIEDPYALIHDNNVDIVVEAMGGNELPYKLIKEALCCGKHVVTSNKEVVSLHLNEFNQLAKANNAKFMFEASVGGGVPIIHSLMETVKFDKVNHVLGILNGTTNFILTKIEEGYSFDLALKEAQRLGFAEANPTADLEGLDMVRKIAILTDIINDSFVNINDIYHYGITNVKKEYIDYLKDKGYTLKFVAEAKENKNGYYLRVEPVVISLNEALSKTKNEFNYITYDAKSNDTLAFIGKGAGKYPTASAMVSDIKKIEENSFKNSLNYSNRITINNEINAKFFVVDKDDNYSFTDKVSFSSLDLNNIKFYGRVIENEKI